MMPTLWLLEGFTYYLTEDAIAGTFKDMASLSGRGSVFVACMAPASLINEIHKAEGPAGALWTQWKWGFPTDFTNVRMLLRCPRT
jgi:O-methyltransferase involved in polyketide biosynthesis